MNDTKIGQSSPEGGGVDEQVGVRASRARFNSIDCPILAFDTEYTVSKGGKSNSVLCYTYSIGDESGRCEDIIYTKALGKSGRITLSQLVTKAVNHAIDEGVLGSYPEELIIAAHFLRADLSSLSDVFSKLKLNVGGVRKTLASLSGSYGVDIDSAASKNVGVQELSYTDRNRHRRTIMVKFYDSILLAPAGKSLAGIGELVGVPKLEIPAPYSIERMDEYLKADKKGFELYALVDAEICFHFLIMVRKFVRDDLGFRGLPVTVGGMATKLFLKNMDVDKNSAFGVREEVTEYWPKGGSRPVTKKALTPTFSRSILESMATDCYHGGRNECFYTGPTPVDVWNDFDIPSCYIVSMTNLCPLDYDGMTQVYSSDDFIGGVYGVARVRFKFPEGTRFPSLPVRTEKYGLYYPLEGESLCTSFEIETALYLGCVIQILQGFTIPLKSSERIFLPFIQQVRQKRLSYTKASFEERLWKEVGNSLYGKLAQGLSGKSGFDVPTGLSKGIPSSAITNPYFATFTTGLVRAVLSEMLAGVPKDKLVLSVTTDGFLTNADLSEIDLSGPSCRRFKALYRVADPEGGEILELKHQVEQLLVMKTRGASTLQAKGSSDPILAKASVQVPQGVLDPVAYMNKLYLSRHPGQQTTSKRLTSTRKQFLNSQDMLSENQEVRLNLEPDFKRRLTDPVMVETGLGEHIAFTSEAWGRRSEGEFTRVRFDKWRETNCLKAVADWDSFCDFIAMSKLTRTKGVKIKSGERSDRFLARIFLRAYAQEELGLKRSLTYLELSEWFTARGYEITASTARSGRSSALVLGAVPLTAYTVELLQQLLDEFSEFDFYPLFGCDSAALDAALAE